MSKTEWECGNAEVSRLCIYLSNWSCKTSVTRASSLYRKQNLKIVIMKTLKLKYGISSIVN